MVKLLTIADDSTGAFDAGVQFAAKGVATTVVIDSVCDFRPIGKTAEVLIMAAETRHLQPQEAYEIVHHTVHKALQAGISYICKEIDSALRGNVDSELTVLVDTAGVDALPLLSALPKFSRITKTGTHYIGGVSVAQSVFGQNSFRSVLNSEVAEILGRQTAVPMVMHSQMEINGISNPGIQIFDAETDVDLGRIDRQLGLERLRSCAGCAGFAAVLVDLLNLEGQVSEPFELESTLFIFCGSVNPVTICQMKAVWEQGFPHVNLNPAQKLERSWVDSDPAGECVRQWLAQVSAEKRSILDANDPEGCEDTEPYAREQGLTSEQARVRIPENLAALMKRMLDDGLKATFLCTGGDTLLVLMRTVGAPELTPTCEVATGAVLVGFVYKEKTYHIISKSGGFDDQDPFVTLVKRISRKSTIY